jgi:hypothetical protein
MIIGWRVVDKLLKQRINIVKLILVNADLTNLVRPSHALEGCFVFLLETRELSTSVALLQIRHHSSSLLLPLVGSCMLPSLDSPITPSPNKISPNDCWNGSVVTMEHMTIFEKSDGLGISMFF